MSVVRLRTSVSTDALLGKRVTDQQRHVVRTRLADVMSFAGVKRSGDFVKEKGE